MKIYYQDTCKNRRTGNLEASLVIGMVLVLVALLFYWSEAQLNIISGD